MGKREYKNMRREQLAEGLVELMSGILESLRKYVNLKPGDSFCYRSDIITKDKGIESIREDYRAVRAFNSQFLVVVPDIVDFWDKDYKNLNLLACEEEKRYLLLGGSPKQKKR